jgi:hypothetical protein
MKMRSAVAMAWMKRNWRSGIRWTGIVDIPDWLNSPV